VSGQCQHCHARLRWHQRLSVATMVWPRPGFWHAVCRQKPLSRPSHSITATAIRSAYSLTRNTVYVGGSLAEWQHAGLRHIRARVQIAAATLSGNSLRQTVHTRRASVHQAATWLQPSRVAGVTAGLAESNGSLPPGRLTAKNQDQLRNHTFSNRIWATFTFFTAYE